VGFSIGGQLALQVAHALPVSQVVLYCPVTSLHVTSTELGFMRYLHEPVAKTMRRWKGDFALDDLAVADPLRYDLQVPQRDMHVIVQRYDALAPVSQIEAIRRKYPAVGWYEYGGTHIYPAGARHFQSVIGKLLQSQS
jgi:acetyl esterase/lipase